MKNSLLLLMLFGTLLSVKLQAQDLIVTTKGDSINCKITRETAEFIHFAYMKEGRKFNTLLPVTRIETFRKAYYGTPAIPFIDTPKARESGWRSGIHAGYSRRIAKVSDQVPSYYKDYINKLKSGYTIGGDLHYFISESMGFGVKYNFNKNKEEDQQNQVEDDISMHYIAASMLTRSVMRNEKNSMSFGVNLGYQSYKDKAKVPGSSLTITGGTFGAGLEMGFGHKISQGSELYFGLALQVASLSKITTDNGYSQQTIELDKEEQENLGRLELTLGLKFGK